MNLRFMLISDPSCFKAFVSEVLTDSRESGNSMAVVYPDFQEFSRIIYGRTPCTFCTFRRNRGKVQKCTEEGRRFRYRRPLYPRLYPGNPEKPRIQRPSIEESWNSSDSSEKAPNLASRRYFFSISRIFREIPGLEKVEFDLTALLFCIFAVLKSTKVHGVLEF